MGIPKKTLNQIGKKEKKGGYEGISSMNHFDFMEIDDHVDL
jgi:hypothetical protein